MLVDVMMAAYNIFLGINAGKGSSTISDNTGGENIAIGLCAGNCLVTGCYNTFIGKYSGRDVTCGNQNIAIGLCAGLEAPDLRMFTLVVLLVK